MTDKTPRLVTLEEYLDTQKRIAKRSAQRKWLASLTPAQADAVRAATRERVATARANMTPEQRDEAKARRRELDKARRSNRT